MPRYVVEVMDGQRRFKCSERGRTAEDAVNDVLSRECSDKPLGSTLQAWVRRAKRADRLGDGLYSAVKCDRGEWSIFMERCGRPDSPENQEAWFDWVSAPSPGLPPPFDVLPAEGAPEPVDDPRTVSERLDRIEGQGDTSELALKRLTMRVTALEQPGACAGQDVTPQLDAIWDRIDKHIARLVDSERAIAGLVERMDMTHAPDAPKAG